MIWSKFKKFWRVDDVDETYTQYLPKDGHVFAIEDQYGDTYMTDYMQIMIDEDGNEKEFVFQTLGNDVINIPIHTHANVTIVPLTVYKELKFS